MSQKRLNKMLLRALCIFVFPVLIITAAALYHAPLESPLTSHLQKINREGQIISAWSGPWSCVCDARSNLLWEVKTDDEGIHDGNWTYSWLKNGVGVANGGDCYFEPERCDSEDLLRHTNTEKLCGRNNWRLPSSKELQSLVFSAAHPGQPLIDKNYFPMSKRGDYWTNESEQPLQGVYRYLQTGSSAVDFTSGNTVTIPYRNAAFVRLVSNMSEGCN